MIKVAIPSSLSSTFPQHLAVHLLEFRQEKLKNNVLNSLHVSMCNRFVQDVLNAYEDRQRAYAGIFPSPSFVSD